METKKQINEKIKPCKVGKHRWHNYYFNLPEKSVEKTHAFICDRCGFTKTTEMQGSVESKNQGRPQEIDSKKSDLNIPAGGKI